jgi:hypothetical protein
MFDEAQIETIATWLHGVHQPRRRSDDNAFEWRQVATTTSEAFRNEIGPYLRSAAPDERPLHLQQYVSWKTGFQKVKVTLKLLIITDVRVWIVEHSEGQVQQPRIYGWEQTRVTKKKLTMGGFKEEQGGLEVLSAGDTAGELEQLIAGRGTAGPTSSLQAILNAGMSAAVPMHAAAGGAWHPDPTGRHELRWWDGTAWTANVSDGGVTVSDPLPS